VSKCVAKVYYFDFLELHRIRGGEQSFKKFGPFRPVLDKIVETLASDLSRSYNFFRLLLCYAAEQSASWRHRCYACIKHSQYILISLSLQTNNEAILKHHF